MALLRSRTEQHSMDVKHHDYWDIHNHILPGVDDGAGYLEESIELIREERAQGVRHIIFTPHYRPEMFTVSAKARKQTYENFINKARALFPDMHFSLGCEVHVHDKLSGTLQNEVNRMCGTNIVLLEYSTNGEYRRLEQTVLQMLEEGYHPILAHAERYLCLYTDRSRVLQLQKAGALIQINAGSFLEPRRSPRRKFAHALMEREAVDFIASDAHDLQYRKVCIEPCARLITKQYGQAMADKVFRINQENLFS